MYSFKGMKNDPSFLPENIIKIAWDFTFSRKEFKLIENKYY